jgi:hypothetical protein
MRAGRILLATLGLLMLAASASAECAWVLWTQEHPPSGHRDERKWTALNAYVNEQACRSVESLATRTAPTGPSSAVCHYLCLPDTVDPRGAKR